MAREYWRYDIPMYLTRHMMVDLYLQIPFQTCSFSLLTGCFNFCWVLQAEIQLATVKTEFGVGATAGNQTLKQHLPSNKCHRDDRPNLQIIPGKSMDWIHLILGFDGSDGSSHQDWRTTMETAC